MRIYTFSAETRISAPLEKVWDFFSTPYNLKQLTPPSLNFTILSNPPAKVYPGLLIHYTVSPFLGIPIQWVTEISHCDEQRSFIDEQRFGPFRLWHHRHSFREEKEEVVMTDDVHYALYCDPFSRVVHHCIVRKRVEEIFRYRESAIRALFS